MHSQTLGQRGHLFSFDRPYFHNTLVLSTETQAIVCDTSCGPVPMEPVKNLIASLSGPPQTVVFNSHHHYDHVWGNCAFKHCTIYGHRLCAEMLEEVGQQHLVEFAAHRLGNVVLVPPNQTFDNVVVLDDGNIEMFHSPGHTSDSASLIDRTEGLLFVGDNVESPIPFIFAADIDRYVATLVEYQSMEWRMMVAGHDPVLTDGRLLKSNIEYLTSLRDWTIRVADLPQEARARHIENLVELGKLVNPQSLQHDAAFVYEDAIEYIRSLTTRGGNWVPTMVSHLERIASQIPR